MKSNVTFKNNNNRLFVIKSLITSAHIINHRTSQCNSNTTQREAISYALYKYLYYMYAHRLFPFLTLEGLIIVDMHAHTRPHIIL